MNSLIAMSPAWSFSIGLIATFVIIIGGLVNILLAYIAVQVLSERQQNLAIEEEHVTG